MTWAFDVTFKPPCYPVPDDEMDMMEKVNHRKPCERAALQFAANGSRRTMNLSDLKAEKGHCVWCDIKLTGRKQRWCSDDCANAAMFLANPQSPAAKMNRLIFHQKFGCAGCGLSFEDEIRKRIRYLWHRENAEGAIIWTFGAKYGSHKRTADDPEYKVSFHRLGDNTGHIHQTDHIIPVHKGGEGIAPENLQVLCVPCHKKKTREDHSKWR